MRGVAANQQWGVWGAGPAQRPGNKDGWSFESDPYGKHWVTDTVGFAGPAERYTLAIMYQVGPAGSLADGVHAVSDVAALLFGAPAPARVDGPRARRLTARDRAEWHTRTAWTVVVCRSRRSCAPPAVVRSWGRLGRWRIAWRW